MYAYIIYTYTYDLKSCDEDSAHALVTVGLQSLRLGAVCGLCPQPKIWNWNPKTLEPRITEFAFDLQSGGNFAGTIIFGDYFLWNVKFTVLGLHNMFLEVALLVNHLTKEEELCIDTKDSLVLWRTRIIWLNCSTMWAALFISWHTTPSTVLISIMNHR
jgi:hypothetical protein